MSIDNSLIFTAHIAIFAPLKNASSLLSVLNIKSSQRHFAYSIKSISTYISPSCDQTNMPLNVQIVENTT